MDGSAKRTSVGLLTIALVAVLVGRDRPAGRDQREAPDQYRHQGDGQETYRRSFRISVHSIRLLASIG